MFLRGRRRGPQKGGHGMLRVAVHWLHKRALARPSLPAAGPFSTSMDAAAPHSPPTRPTPPEAKRRRPDAWGAKRVSSYLTVGRPWEAVEEYWAAVVSGTHQLEDLVRSALPEPPALALPNNPPQPAGDALGKGVGEADAGPKPERGAEWREQRTFRVEVLYLGPAFGGWQVILPPAPGVSNEGGRSPLLVPLPAVSWPWVPGLGPVGTASARR